MQSLDARLKELEARALQSHRPGGAGRIHAWLTAHGIDVPPPESPDMLLTDFLKLMPTAALRAILEAHKPRP